MLHAAAWAGLAASTLLVGAWLGIVWNASQRAIGLVMGFGAGALIASVSFELTEEAFDRAGGVPLAVGLAAGALTYWFGDRVIDRMGDGSDQTALALLLGAGLDAIPESLIIGLSLTLGGAVETAFLVSVAVSNIPEGLASASAQHRAGEPTGPILARWAVIVAMSAVFGAIGFALFDDLPVPRGRGHPGVRSRCAARDGDGHDGARGVPRRGQGDRTDRGRGLRVRVLPERSLGIQRPEEARVLAGVAGRALLVHAREHDVGVAIDAQLLHVLHVAARVALAPQLLRERDQ